MQAKSDKKKAISENLQKLLAQRGLSQKDFAELAGVSKISLNRWMKGKMTPSTPALKKMADFLGVTPEEICPASQINTSCQELSAEEWRTRALIAEAKLAHLSSACAALGQHVQALGTTVNEFGKIISE